MLGCQGPRRSRWFSRRGGNDCCRRVPRARPRAVAVVQHLYYVFITIYKVLLNVPPVQHLHPTYHFL